MFVQNLTTSGTFTLKSGQGKLHAIVVNTAVASATIKLYDNIANSGASLGVITLPSTVGNPFSLPYGDGSENNQAGGCPFFNGLTVVTSGAMDLTFIFE